MIQRRWNGHLLSQDREDPDRYSNRLPSLEQLRLQLEWNPGYRVERVREVLVQLKAKVPTAAGRLRLRARMRSDQAEKEDDTDAQQASHRHLRTESAVL
jgi:hypothetical protein